MPNDALLKVQYYPEYYDYGIELKITFLGFNYLPIFVRFKKGSEILFDFIKISQTIY